MSWGDYGGLVAANAPPAPEFFARRVLKNYGDMTTSEFQSHLIKLDTTFRGDRALNSGNCRKTRTSLCTCRAGPSCSSASRRPVASGEPAGVAPSPTSDDRLRHQRERRELLVVQPRGPPEAATGLFRGLRSKLATSEGPSSSTETAAMVARDVGLDKFVMVLCCDPRSSATSFVTRGLCSWTSFRSAAATSAPKAGEWTR